MARRDAVERVTELLRTAPPAPMVGVIAGHLERLAGDTMWDVRHAVAHALLHLHHDTFDRILGKLLDDSNTYVRTTADNTMRRRRRVTRAAERKEEDLESVVSRINRLRARFPEDVVEEALEVGRAYYEAAAATATHDILTILTALREQLRSHRRELDRRKVARKAWEPVLDRAESRCDALEAIASSMKMFADRTRPVFHKENVLEMVEDALGIVRDRHRADPEPAEIEANVSIDRHLVIDAPRVQLVQALSNVIRNAYESIAGRGVVSITGKVGDDGQIVLRITDNGCGIATEDTDAAFLPGISTKKHSRPHCSGFGLAIAQKVVEVECRGHIRIESVEGTGTTVTIVLPMEREPEDEE